MLAAGNVIQEKFCTSILCLLVAQRAWSFTYAAPSVWNSLPCQVRSSITLTAFKSSLKSHLFRLSYWLCVCVCACAFAHTCVCACVPVCVLAEVCFSCVLFFCIVIGCALQFGEIAPYKNTLLLLIKLQCENGFKCRNTLTGSGWLRREKETAQPVQANALTVGLSGESNFSILWQWFFLNFCPSLNWLMEKNHNNGIHNATLFPF